MRKNGVAMLVSSRLLVSLCVGQRLAGGGKFEGAMPKKINETYFMYNQQVALSALL